MSWSASIALSVVRASFRIVASSRARALQFLGLSK